MEPSTMVSDNEWDLTNLAEETLLVIPLEDLDIIQSTGSPGLVIYWLACWKVDPYGYAYKLMPDVDFKNATQSKYRRQLEMLEFFSFEVRKQRNSQTLWLLNQHGSRRNAE